MADRILNLVDGRIVSNVTVKEAVRYADFLSKCPLFTEQPPAMLAEVAERMQRESFEADETIIRQGEIGDKSYIIESGSVEVSGENEGTPFRGISLQTADFFGEVALLTGEARNATVVAWEPVQVLTLAQEHFEDALQRSKTLEEQLRDVLYRRT